MLQQWSTPKIEDRCPLCYGQIVHAQEPRLTGIDILRGAQIEPLTPAEVVIVGKMMAVKGYVSGSELYRAYMGYSHPNGQGGRRTLDAELNPDLVKAVIMRLRRKLIYLGGTIDHRRGCGYKLRWE
jgi:cystathionine beta-lyase family protein involved in aluminum resistance